ncbi:MAG TPA: SRPBCC domain-containing protein [Sporichthya sp.]|nr:SRPBCC domain-containing protein [Sporichthya sp.]
MSGKIATAAIDVSATPERVWSALTEPKQISAYMWGSQVETTWEVGSPITWSGEYEGRPYQDKGEVLTYDEPRLLSVTHYSPMTGEPDVPESYHTLVYTLTASGDGTHLDLTQDKCTDDAQVEQFSQTWQQMLDGLKTHVES